MRNQLSRRELMKLGMMAAGGLGVAGKLATFADAQSQDLNAGWKPGDPVGYINSGKIPNFTLPPYKGEHYDATVPDTLDISERARLAVNVLTEATDPLAD